MSIEIKLIPELADESKQLLVEDDILQFLLDDGLDYILEKLAKHNVRLEYAVINGTTFELHRKVL